MNDVKNKQLNYRPDIDGLRAIAVLGVLLFHLSASYMPGGYVGVDIFFVISGYLITRIILKEMNAGTFTFAYFYERRIRRIFPALFFVLAVCIPLAFVTLYEDALLTFVGDLKYAAAQISNIHFAKDIDYFRLDAEQSPLLHTWSLGVEEQFYVVWPLLLLAVFKFGKKALPWVMGAVIVSTLVFSEFLLGYDEALFPFADNKNQAFYMLYARAFELAIGGLLAIPFFQQKRFGALGCNILSIIGAVLIAISYIFITKSVMFPGALALLPSLGAAFIIYAHTGGERTIVGQVLSVRPLVYIGLISYSLYLWHWPFITMYDTYTLGAGISHQTALWLGGASIICAALTHKFIETPFRRYRKDGDKSHKKRVFFVALACIACFIIVSDTWKDHLEEKLKQGAYTDLKPAYTNGIGKVYGADQPYAPIVLSGDSHSAAYLDGVYQWAHDVKGKPLEFIGRAACQLSGDDQHQIWNKEKCQTFRAELNRRIEDTQHPIDYLIFANRYDGLIIDMASNNVSAEAVDRFYKRNAQKFLDGVVYTLEKMKKYHPEGKVIVMGQVPKLAMSPKHCAQREKVLMNKIVNNDYECVPYTVDPLIDEKVVRPFNAALKELLSKYDNGIYFDPDRPFPPNENDRWWVYYKDHNHLSHEGGFYLSSFFNF